MALLGLVVMMSTLTFASDVEVVGGVRVVLQDLCAWNFGSTYIANNGATANVRVGARDFLLQQLWVNAYGGYCALTYNMPGSRYVMGAMGDSCSTTCQKQNMVCNPAIVTGNSVSLFTSLGISCIADTRYGCARFGVTVPTTAATSPCDGTTNDGHACVVSTDVYVCVLWHQTVVGR